MDIEPRSKENLIKQFREETLTDAARKIMNEEGFAGLTIERVAELAGVSKGTIYLYFKNKEDLLHATVASTFAALLHEVRRETENAAGFESKLSALVETQLRVFAANLTFLRSLIAPNRFRPNPKCHPVNDEVIALHREFVRYVASILELGRGEGRVREDCHCEEAAFHIFQMLQGTGMRHALGLAAEPLGSPAEIRRIVQFITSGIGRQGV